MQAATVIAMALNLMMMILPAVSGQQGDLDVAFYKRSCPAAESVVASAVKAYSGVDPSLPAGLLRLHFHDCFVHGCDASILIEGPNTEKTAMPNLGLKGFKVIEYAKEMIEEICPGVVSCADILAWAARDAVNFSGGRPWEVQVGRRDGLISSASDGISDLPSPMDSMDKLIQKFAAKDLSRVDLATLVGAHTIGQTNCTFFHYRLYNFSATHRPQDRYLPPSPGQLAATTENGAGAGPDPSIDKGYLGQLQLLCPLEGDPTDRVDLDDGSQLPFDTSFYRNVMGSKGTLESDQLLMQDGVTRYMVKTYTKGNGRQKFYIDFGKAMVKMGRIGVKTTGADGEIRKVCSAFNSEFD